MQVYYDTIDGCGDRITLAATSKGLCFVSNDYDEMVEWLSKVEPSTFSRDTEKMAMYTERFRDYFEGKNPSFKDIRLDIRGTDFQKAVWNELVKIEFGSICCYSDIAEAIHKPKAVRAVASAIGKNPLLIVIPCHRVIGKNGKLTGFRSGLALKQQLLTLEKGNAMLSD